ncbi:MAG: 3-oxoacyl-ACP reductase FabG [Candidatus Aenigmarchaeota archaeon]|nr:3-oxoacyl-ACP reductase FabG [Candidatus Aenigmarchaeota archaeon]
MKLKDKVVIVTGASSGIGEATALKFAKEGANIVIDYKSDYKSAQRVADSAQKIGSNALVVQCDVSIPEDVEKMFNQALKSLGRVDILINNAGVADEPEFLKAAKEDWLKTFNNNFFGTMICSQHAARIMLKQKNGKIINISSIYGLENAGKDGLIAYSAAKAAVINFTQTLAKILAPNITVNAVAPGYVDTPPWKNVPEKIKNRYIGRTYLKRWIQPEEIGNACLYLATAEAVTGEVLIVDAGRTLIEY